MKERTILLAALGFLLSFGQVGCKQKPTTPIRAKSASGAHVFFVEPADGQTFSRPVSVKFGLEGMELAPAGEVKDRSGHHHLLIDTDPLPPMNQPLPFTDQLLHFGQGQTETQLQLPRGEHTLQLVFAGGNHVPHEPPVVSEKIKITMR